MQTPYTANTFLNHNLSTGLKKKKHSNNDPSTRSSPKAVGTYKWIHTKNIIFIIKTIFLQKVINQDTGGRISTGTKYTLLIHSRNCLTTSIQRL